MRLLGKTDLKDYDMSFNFIRRTSARIIIIKDKKIYLSHASRNNTYKLPGGGVDSNESILDAAIRETKEEVGIIVDEKSIKEYGYYVDTWKSVKFSDGNKIWENTSYYFVAKPLELIKPSPTKSEIEDMCESVLIDIDTAINANLEYINKEGNNLIERFLIREVEIFKLIKEELIK